MRHKCDGIEKGRTPVRGQSSIYLVIKVYYIYKLVNYYKKIIKILIERSV